MDKMTERYWGDALGGSAVSLYTLTNANGMQASITNYGGALTSLLVPDDRGDLDDIVLGYDNLAQYVENVGNPHFGALIGRYGNRIAKGQFTLDGETYHLPINNGPNSLHGGIRGFDKQNWHGELRETDEGGALVLSYVSKHGEEGYPGNLNVQVTYTLTDKNELKLEYVATTNEPTVLNLTNHSYFNLAGAGNGTILDHDIKIEADCFTPTDDTQIPTGEIASVDGSPFDFRKLRNIGQRINLDDEQLKYGKGYDHNFVINGKPGELHEAAWVFEKASRRSMRVFTTQPGVQFYTGNALKGDLKGPGGKIFQRRGALCLETQHFPDSPNQPQFPSTVLRPGETYRELTIFRFGVE